jgi:hypothetical protein
LILDTVYMSDVDASPRLAFTDPPIAMRRL